MAPSIFEYELQGAWWGYRHQDHFILPCLDYGKEFLRDVGFSFRLCVTV